MDEIKQINDTLIGTLHRVLSDGHVRVVDVMGSDQAIVQAARVSYGAGTKRIHEDRGLIRYLMRHHHTTPFEMCEIKLHVRVPMDCWRQWIRHRTANVNEYSTRYSVAIDSMQETDALGWRLQSTDNKQGSGENAPFDIGSRLSTREKEFHKAAREVYEERLGYGVAREQARKDLPLSSFTEAYWKIDLHNLLNFLFLRMDSHAQFEIRQYANVIGQEIVRKWVPLTWEAFLDFRLHGMHLSSMEVEALSHLHLSGEKQMLEFMIVHGWLDRKDDAAISPNREAREFREKLSRMGFIVPWEKVK